MTNFKEEVAKGISDITQNDIENLNVGLAHLFKLFLKTQFYHWTVKGPHFNDYHTLFQSHYEDYIPMIDELGELIRFRKQLPIGSYKDIEKASNLKDANANLTADKMLEDLKNDINHIINHFTHCLTLAKTKDDDTIIDILTTQVGTLEKHYWFLDSSAS